ncbi:type 1 glutamine amidotransferase domain-containing protein [Lentilactobacillus buchneri]|uniref:type 1 glutamine amidotransferase domain-containing protein n=1 Tax=Lentilactobacillus buchneri TaxID=1581 RepID=UPI0012920281|nr:type 1 glutamine amidotransferase domain-containing protein [Lentilactobacillus buchneri]MQM78750.1 type 1 glutamine amidotransferase domain-containing protein [Lentilactobacillus buchneri]MQM88792.1 type 1 glutamine amidotransferase domain-containing protein [Lentilactobacillus buchneri]MQN23250.1 type 1 glutamine amidotransferase domain-containing protein [Lentilactobacillus buchneri]
MKKVLIVLTNVTRYQGTNDPTGLWLGEATEFAETIQKAGIDVDYVSPKGGFVPLDPRSMKYTNESIIKFYETEDFQKRALTNSLRPNEINPDDYLAIYYTGGHGVMWDFPNDRALQQIALSIYDNGGYITSVCHGVAGLLNIKDDAGRYLIAGKSITGFTTAKEIIAGKKSVVPFLNKQAVEKRGGKFKKKRAYKEYAIQDGHLITGQNPFSPRAVARLLLENVQ